MKKMVLRVRTIIIGSHDMAKFSGKSPTGGLPQEWIPSPNSADPTEVEISTKRSRLDLFPTRHAVGHYGGQDGDQLKTFRGKLKMQRTA